MYLGTCTVGTETAGTAADFAGALAGTEAAGELWPQEVRASGTPIAMPVTAGPVLQGMLSLLICSSFLATHHNLCSRNYSRNYSRQGSGQVGALSSFRKMSCTLAAAPAARITQTAERALSDSDGVAPGCEGLLSAP